MEVTRTEEVEEVSDRAHEAQSDKAQEAQSEKAQEAQDREVDEAGDSKEIPSPNAIQEGTVSGTDQPRPAEIASGTPGEREWETDSSFSSSSTDSSDDDSSDEESDEAGDNDYALLSPTEQARILMEDAGSDDEGAKGKATGGGLRTAHELDEEAIPVPDITVTPEMRIEELGVVEAVVERTVLIKGTTTGEYQVLEYGSVLCLEDRSVIGVIADTVGRVQQPLYTVRFASDEAIAKAGVAENGTRVFYVTDHSTFVFTQPLKGIRGSDASNFHDEEVGDDEMEFSDDEKEAEHKRILKLRKKGVDVDSTGAHSGRGTMHGRGGRGGARGRGRGGFQPSLPVHPENAMDTASHATSLNYDDADGGDYEPLRRSSAMNNEAVINEAGAAIAVVALPVMPNFFNPAMAPATTTTATSLNFGQPLAGFAQQNGYAQGYGQPMQQYGTANAWANNQTAAQQVARQLEELRRGQGGPN
ncbi:hypothetical protein DV737_g3188, partial [Chaetothyriales sp. CBS 132003]